MMPRPRSRRKPVEVVALEELAEEVRVVTADEGLPPVAIVSGHREWQMMKRQVDHRAFVSYWPGGEETFLGVPVIINRTLKDPTPRAIATQPELEELILGE